MVREEEADTHAEDLIHQARKEATEVAAETKGITKEADHIVTQVIIAVREETTRVEAAEKDSLRKRTEPTREITLKSVFREDRLKFTRMTERAEKEATEGKQDATNMIEMVMMMTEEELTAETDTLETQEGEMTPDQEGTPETIQEETTVSPTLQEEALQDTHPSTEAKLTGQMICKKILNNSELQIDKNLNWFCIN